MRFRSVEDPAHTSGFGDALFSGLAPDGALYAPVTIPALTERDLRSASLHDAGVAVLAPFIDAIPPDALRDIVERAWTWPVPLTPLGDGVYLIEEFHGPTLAFKDLGARFMAGAMAHFLGREGRRITILVATSGDTGSAVAHGFHGAAGIDVFVLYPSKQVSPLQEKQMATLGGNIHALEVRGTFDDCQALVKRALGDPDIARRRTVTTANSINLGRLLPQVAFYAWTWSQWISMRGPKEPLGLVVPSGNFGNLTAALYAKRLGVPLGPVTAATNSNRVVPEYLRTGRYEPGASKRTHSSAMDVGDPSNWVRIEELYGRDLQAIRADVSGCSVTDEETLRTIRDTYESTGIILDPHTAVGVRAALGRVQAGGGPVAVAATAHPGKFPEVIGRALGEEPEIPEALAVMMDKPVLSRPIAADFDSWKGLLLSPRKP